jgi:hypothetical protein
VLYRARSPDSCGVLERTLIAVLWMVLERFISLEVQLVMIEGRKLKNRRARNIGIRMGIGQENHCQMLFPRGFQESSISHLHFSNFLERCHHWGIPLSLTAVGVMRMTR